VANGAVRDVLELGNELHDLIETRNGDGLVSKGVGHLTKIF